MKIILINPPTINLLTATVPEVYEEEVDYVPTLGILYIAGYLQNYTDHQVKILDCDVEGINYQNMPQIIERENPDVVGLTAMTFTLLDAIQTARLVKKINPQIKTIIGGPHGHIYPEETIKIPVIDYLVLGEGEQVIQLLLDNLDNPAALKKIKGLVFKNNGKIINTGPPSLIENLDDLPFPARELTPYQKYFSVIASHRPVSTMITSRGCPFRCSFCYRPHLGKVFRARSASNVVDEMEQCKKMGINEIFIYDDTFTINRQRVIDICQEIEKRNLQIAWDIRARVDTVDKELLMIMSKNGCQRIHYGVEAGTQKIMNVLNKGITPEKVERAFQMTKEAGIQTLAFFMIGSPTETLVDIKQSISFAKKIKPDYIYVSITTPFPATPIYQQGLSQGILPYDYWREFARNPRVNFQPHFWEENFNRQELIALLKKFYRSFYWRPSYVIKTLLRLKSWPEFKAKFQAGLNMLKI